MTAGGCKTENVVFHTGTLQETLGLLSVHTHTHTHPTFLPLANIFSNIFTFLCSHFTQSNTSVQQLGTLMFLQSQELGLFRRR